MVVLRGFTNTHINRATCPSWAESTLPAPPFPSGPPVSGDPSSLALLPGAHSNVTGPDGLSRAVCERRLPGRQGGHYKSTGSGRSGGRCPCWNAGARCQRSRLDTQPPAVGGRGPTGLIYPLASFFRLVRLLPRTGEAPLLRRNYVSLSCLQLCVYNQSPGHTRSLEMSGVGGMGTPAPKELYAVLLYGCRS